MNQPASRLTLSVTEALGLPPDGAEPEYRTTLVRLPASTEKTVRRVRFAVGLSCSPWRLDAATANRLALLAAELVEHVADRVHSGELAVGAVRDGRTATLRVIAHGGTVHAPPDPAALPRIASGDQAGVTRHAFGPSVCVKAQEDRP
ncbi:hypothetical protein [Streptomyces sp. NPDC058757]|uniref:hypothetical protein n=1 Tax=Streptomyces sp. NPDC058757 TaxID=3346626 RepID=UPI003687A0AB